MVSIDGKCEECGNRGKVDLSSRHQWLCDACWRASSEED